METNAEQERKVEQACVEEQAGDKFCGPRETVSLVYAGASEQSASEMDCSSSDDGGLSLSGCVCGSKAQAAASSTDEPLHFRSETQLLLSLGKEDGGDNNEDDCDPAMWDGVVPIEVKADSKCKSEEEDVACEFCSPRLEAGDQIWKRTEVSDHEYEAEGALTLDQLDDDALFLIARFLESRTIRFALVLVCKRFNALFSRDAFYWRSRYTTQVGKKCRCPTSKVPERFHVADQCLAWDDSHRVWQDPDSNTHYLLYSNSMVESVDAVHLMNRGQLIVSGDRNRNLSLIDLTKYPGPDATPAQKDSMLVYADSSTHKGWIWTIDSVDNMIFTGTWDTHIRQFDSAAAGCPVVQDYKCTSAILSLSAEENEIFASCFDKKVYFIDRRSAEMKFRVFHTNAVLCVTGSDKYVISGSEDKRISIFDRRAGKIFKMFKLESYPLCLSYNDNQLWFGDRCGILHLHDGTDGMFKHIGSYDIGHTQKMMGVVNTAGAVFTCSGDGYVKVMEPARDPAVLASLKGHVKEVACVAYSHDVLASSGDDGISLWLPKHWSRNTYLL